MKVECIKLLADPETHGCTRFRVFKICSRQWQRGIFPIQLPTAQGTLEHTTTMQRRRRRSSKKVSTNSTILSQRLRAMVSQCPRTSLLSSRSNCQIRGRSNSFPWRRRNLQIRPRSTNLRLLRLPPASSPHGRLPRRIQLHARKASATLHFPRLSLNNYGL